MRNLFLKSSIRVLAAASVAGLSVAAMAQNAGTATGQPTQPLTGAAKEQQLRRQTMLRDFIHALFIHRTDWAAGLGQQLLNENMTGPEFVDLVEKSGELERFEEAIGRAMRTGDVETTAAALVSLYERGKLERVRNPDEIARNIELLKRGTQRATMLARERLFAAGEYAMPQLLQALLQNQDMHLKAQAQRLLVDMGQHAVIPLCTALAGLDPAQQEMVIDILGLVGYRTALPFLYDVLTGTSSAPVRQACDRAIQRIGPSGETDPALLYQQLGEAYYAERAELTSFPGETHQLLWNFDPGVGLFPTAIRTEVYHEAMAMRVCERSLALRPQGNDDALSLWLAANFNREIQQPAGYDNPAYPKTRRDAMYFAVAAGAGPSQSVLARGLDDRNTQLARRAIAAIEQTAGGNALLWGGNSARSPLVDALRYPNRRVQYEAALAMGRAQPQQAFPAAERVVPILASAIRDAGVRYAAVVATNREIGDSVRRTLERAGYTLMPVSATLGELAQPIAEVPGVDLVVVAQSGDAANATIAETRRVPKLAATPVLALVPGPSVIDMSRRYDRDPLVSVRSEGLREDQLAAAAAELVESAVGGPITSEEARQYATRALAVLRDLAVSGNTVFDVGDAALPLIGALGETTGPMRLEIAEVLSRVDQKRAQVALMDAALNAAGEERVALLGKVADSAKRFGNLLEQRQVERVLDLATNGPDQEATAAAALVGSLNLPNTNLVPLILGKKS